MNHTDQRWQESNPDLVSIIRDEVTASGPISFERFMDLALYHPEHGYYRAESPAPGRAGDFLTAPEAHPIFGAVLAGQIVAFDAALGHPAPFTIIEYGAGSGKLIRPLLAEIRQKLPDLYARISYTPVELNVTRRTELIQHLADGGHQERLSEDTNPSTVIGCVLANEFIDAFPARRFVQQGDTLHEIHVDWQDGWFAEVTTPVDDSATREYLERHGYDLQPGEQFELHPGIERWVQDVDQALSRGSVLIIDYGYPAQELFNDHRRNGTVRAYHQHGVTTELYRGIGRQDLTAHVNFSELQWQAEQHGFTLDRLTTQAELLESLGLGERLFALQSSNSITSDEYLATRAAVLRMIDPGAMGRFRVMMLSR
ncbi:MAG: SAM-dependent methyltransferase [Sphaerobacteraceae bacterium]|nr:MAG: SAM-dependent methyltransferase [Sphaerobacteraceae bacterium]